MQGEKVAADIREARDHLSGDAAILPMLLSVSRRLQRRMAQAPALIEPSVKALDEAIEALEGATQAVEDALEACAFDPARARALRGEAVRAPRDEPQARRADRKPAGAGAEIRRRSRRARRRAQRGPAPRGRVRPRARGLSHAAPARSAPPARSSARALETAVTAELPPLKLERAEFRVDLTTRRSARRAERLRSGRVPGPHQSRLASGAR